MTTKTISLTRALKLKKRLAGQMTRYTQDILAYNSVQIGQKGQCDVKEVVAKRSEVRDAIIMLKNEINKNSGPVLESLWRLQETKGEAELFASLSTTDGKLVSMTRYGGESPAVEYIATFKKRDVDEKLNQLNRLCADLQDQLDDYNAKTNITIDSRIEELIGSGQSGETAGQKSRTTQR